VKEWCKLSKPPLQLLP